MLFINTFHPRQFYLSGIFHLSIPLSFIIQNKSLSLAIITNERHTLWKHLAPGQYL